MEKLITWWPDGNHDVTRHNSENWPQEMETNWLWNWRLTVLITRWRWSDHQWLISRWLSEMTVLFLHVSLFLRKSSCSLIVGRGAELDCGQGVLPPLTPTPTFPLLASKINFPFHHPCLLTGFWVGSSQISTFRYIETENRFVDVTCWGEGQGIEES